MTPRSWLFVPGDSPEKMGKALQSAADALILDIEDAIAQGRKAQARRCISDFVGSGPSGLQIWVRVNPLASPEFDLDLEVLTRGGFSGLVLPKCESARDLLELDRRLGAAGVASGVGVLPIAVETGASLFGVGAYGGVTSRLRGLTWGGEDLAADVGAVASRDPDGRLSALCELARCLCLAGAAAARVPAIETVYPDFRDLAALAAYAERGRREGFAGMLAIHPSQAPVINAAFTPSQAEIDHAMRIVGAFRDQPGAGVVAMDGKMLDAPHLAQAERLLARAAGKPAERRPPAKIHAQKGPHGRAQL